MDTAAVSEVRRYNVWIYYRGEWTRALHPLGEGGHPTSPKALVERRSEEFASQPVLVARGPNTVSVRLYSRNAGSRPAVLTRVKDPDDPYREATGGSAHVEAEYAVLVGLGNHSEPIFVTDLPSMIRLVNELGPLILIAPQA